MQLFSKKQLEKATKNFDESRLLGSGASGSVYLGELNGEFVAIKRATINVNKNGVKVRFGSVFRKVSKPKLGFWKSRPRKPFRTFFSRLIEDISWKVSKPKQDFGNSRSLEPFRTSFFRLIENISRLKLRLASAERHVSTLS